MTAGEESTKKLSKELKLTWLGGKTILKKIQEIDYNILNQNQKSGFDKLKIFFKFTILNLSEYLSTEHIEITQSSKTKFLYSFSLLPKDKFEAINTVYAFCRQTDDIVDNEMDTTELKLRKIREWKNEFEKALKGSSNYSIA